MSRGGSERLVRDLYERYRDAVYADVRRMTDEHTAEDVVQETFVRLARYGEGKLRTATARYLKVIARNVLHDTWRASGQAGSAGGARPELFAARDDHRAPVSDIRAMLGKLTEPQREALMLTAAYGLTSSEASRSLDVSGPSVTHRRTKALAKLRTLIEEERRRERAEARSA